MTQFKNSQIRAFTENTPSDYDGQIDCSNSVSGVVFNPYNLGTEGSITFIAPTNPTRFGFDNFKIISDGITPVGTNINSVFVGKTNLPDDFILELGAYEVFIYNTPEGISISFTLLDTLTIPDTTDPSAVDDLDSTNITDTSVRLTWTEPTDNVGVTDYEVFQDGVSIGKTGGALLLDVTGLTAETSYDFTVYAEDEAGNVSAVSNTETVVTLVNQGDITAPSTMTISSIVFDGVDITKPATMTITDVTLV